MGGKAGSENPIVDPLDYCYFNNNKIIKTFIMRKFHNVQMRMRMRIL